MASKAKTGFDVLCPDCLEAEMVSIDVHTLRCTCSGCGNEFTPEEARLAMDQHVVAWSKVVRWVEQARAILAEK